MREKLLEFLNKEITSSDEELSEMLESRGLSDDCTFEDLGRDSDGIPRSHGNFDDVYQDGFHYGVQQGSFNFMLKIKNYVEALEEK